MCSGMKGLRERADRAVTGTSLLLGIVREVREAMQRLPVRQAPVFIVSESA